MTTGCNFVDFFMKFLWC